MRKTRESEERCRELTYTCMLILTVVSGLSDIVGVEVEEQNVRYFGNTYQTVMVYDTGIRIGVTESFIYGNKR